MKLKQFDTAELAALWASSRHKGDESRMSELGKELRRRSVQDPAALRRRLITGQGIPDGVSRQRPEKTSKRRAA